MPSSVRHTLSSIVVLHPVAAILTLIMFCLTVAFHRHRVLHSPRCLLVLSISILTTFVVCLAGFVINVLLFIPHLSWGTYIILAATIILAISSIDSFTIRRTVTIRSALRKRTDDNAETAGEIDYNRDGQAKLDPIITSQPMVSLLSGENSSDKLPVFVIFESQQKDSRLSDERIVLAQQGAKPSSNTLHNDIANGDVASLTNSRPSLSRDRYGNPIKRPDAYRRERDTEGRDCGPSPGRRGAHGWGDCDPPPQRSYRQGAQLSQTSLGRGGTHSVRGPEVDKKDLPRAESRPSLLGKVPGDSQAKEMSIAPLGPPPENPYGHHDQFQDSNADVGATVDPQQGHSMGAGGRETFLSEGSECSTDE